MTDFRSWLQYVDAVVEWMQRNGDAAFFQVIAGIIVAFGFVKMRPLIVLTGGIIGLFGLYDARYGEVEDRE